MTSSAPLLPAIDRPAPRNGLDAPAARRNAGPLFAVLVRELPAHGTVLEIGAGTGQHAAAFAPGLAPLKWLPTDRSADQLASIAAWSDTVPPDAQRPLAPRVLDASQAVRDWPIAPRDEVRAMLSVNMVHIAPWPVAIGMLAGAAALLTRGDPLVLYGPFARAGRHTGPGNRQFDRELRAQNPQWGVRDLELDIVPAAEAAGLALSATHKMPADNLTVVLRRR